MAKFTPQEVDALQRGGNQVMLFPKASMVIIIHFNHQLLLTYLNFTFAES
jgi:hypothetical protein